MPQNILQKSANLLLKRQTNILSAAYIIMITVVLSLLLGLLRTRLLFAIFGASNTLGVYNYATILPDTIFQLTIAAAFASAFIPVFSDYLSKGKEKEGHIMASTLLTGGLVIFLIFSTILIIFAPYVLAIFNLGAGFTKEQMTLMVQMMRLIIIGQTIYIVGSFFTALLQAYNHFFIPGIAAATYNLGIIIGILLFHKQFGIYSVPLGIILGALLFVIVQIPLARSIGFRFTPTFSYLKSDAIKKILHLMWPRTLQVAVQQFGTITLAAIISFMIDPGRMHLLFDSAKTLMFASVSFIGFSIAQAAFPILSREKDKMEDFKVTFMTSLNQMLYLILPISALILILRIPIVRLAYGADKFDWPATVLTGRTLAFLSISIFAQGLIVLFYRAFYALQNSVIPLIVSGLSTVFLTIVSFIFVRGYNLGIESVAVAFSLANFFQLLLLFYLLDKRTGGFDKKSLVLSLMKYFFATLLTAFALYIPIKLLDQQVFDTRRTIDLIILTGISSSIGLSLYLFLTWLFDVEEAKSYLQMVRKLGNWREILGYSDEVIDANRVNP